MKKIISSLHLLIFLILTSLSFTSCVGTVEQGVAPQENYQDPEVDNFNFTGIIDAKAISHNKIEVSFFPSFGTSNYSYELYINEGTPILLTNDNLRAGLGGNLVYTIKNLTINASYKLKIRAKASDGRVSSNENEVIVKTFDNEVASFDGVVSVEKKIGSSHDTVILTWVVPTYKGDIFTAPVDPAYFEISYIGQTGGLSNINNITYSGGDRFVRNVPEGQNATASNAPNSVEITGLQPNTMYYFQVRAVHYNYKNNPTLVNREVNTRYVSIRTDSLNGLVNFDVNSITLKNSPARSALNNVEVFWDSGEGTFQGYRVFARKYDGNQDPTLDNKIDEDELIALTADNRYTSVASSGTNATVTGLDSYSWYQFVVALCRDVACTIDSGSPTGAIISQMRAIRTEPTLADFSGISSIGHPSDASNLDKIQLLFDAPAISVGWADTMELFCLDPNNYNNYVQFPSSDGIAISGSSIANCNGLYYDQELTTSINKLDIKGVNTLNNVANPELARYCFAMAPAIRDEAEVEVLDPANWIVRCISPEVKTPDIIEFPGIAGVCTIDQNSITVNWDAPTDGIYNRYKVFLYRHPGGSNGFDFSKAISGDVGYTNSGLLSESILTMEIDDLRPGQKYQVGVLAVASDGSSELYSEPNNQVVDCDIPMPTATFKEWTRIFAVGPKVDGTFPKDAPFAKYKDSALILESINKDGIPYEVLVDQNGVTQDVSYITPPGNYLAGATPTLFNQSFDGAFNENGVAASKEGIVSIAWKEVDLSFLGSEFTSGQDLASRTGRTYGYKVFRSDNNRLTWIDLTSDSGLIHAGDYTYRVRSNAADTVSRMGFFTDYSVKYAQSINFVDRAKIVWYKIVPYFDGKPLAFTDNESLYPYNMIKVVIPPANMALVHRKMANRTQCQEMGKEIDEDAHYRCDYNGLGAVQKGVPWIVGQTAFDQQGDLLVDRFELGCSYTRSERVVNLDYSNSFFATADSDLTGYRSHLSDFKGFARASDGAQGGRFNGCVSNNHLDGGEHNQYNKLFTAPLALNSLPVDYDPQYKKVIYGDCIGSWEPVRIANTECSNASVYYPTSNLNYPGIFNENATTPFDCSDNTDVNKPQVLYGQGGRPGLLDKDFRRQWTVQGEHLAVLYNGSANASGRVISPLGPNDNSIMSPPPSIYSFHQSCMVNLASIGAVTDDSPWRSRWVAANQLQSVKKETGAKSIYESTISEIHSNSKVYNATDYRVPPAGLRNANRISDDMPFSQVFASNSSKLPPLKAFRKEDAQRVCQSFSVQTGVNSSGTNWVPTSAPKKKGLMRRKEFITAAAWPETYNTATTTSIENNSLEEDLKCNSSGAYNSRGLPTVGEFISNNIEYGAGSQSGKVLVSGSGRSLAAGSQSSMMCQSKYGVQDLVGNLAELTSDVLFCDYTLDKFYFGKYTGDPVTGLGTGVRQESIRYDLPSDASVMISESATIEYEATGTTQTGNKYWTYIDPNSGYCSLVNTDKDSIPSEAGMSIKYRQPSGIFNPVFDYDGNLNSTMVENAKTFDQIGVNEARNGDGFFLNFGQNHLAPQLSNGNTLALNNSSGTNATTAIGPYFNSVLGIPLKCDLDSCNVQSADNKNLTTEFYSTERAATGNLMSNFPVGSSDIRTLGIGEYVYRNNQHSHQRVLSLSDTFQPVTVITKFIVRANGSIQTETTDTETLFYDRGAGAIENLIYAQWAIDRGQQIYFASGGSAARNYNGRYTMTNYAAGSYWATNYTDQGIRCAVKVNTDD